MHGRHHVQNFRRPGGGGGGGGNGRGGSFREVGGRESLSVKRGHKWGGQSLEDTNPPELSTDEKLKMAGVKLELFDGDLRLMVE